MHIIISGYYGFNNIGDEAILEAIIHALKKEKPNVRITVLSAQPEETTRKFKVESVNRWKPVSIFNVLRKADGLISGGGSLLQDQTSMKSIPYYTSIIHLAKFFKLPIFIYAQGIGPVNHRLSRFFIHHTLKRTQFITVRDIASKSYLEGMNLNVPIQLVPDPVFDLVYTFPARLNDLPKKPYIVLSLRDWPENTHFLNELATTCDLLIEKGYHIMTLAMHGASDHRVSLLLERKMRHELSHFPLIVEPHSIFDLLSNAELVIGMRLHALIFSALVGTPFAALSYDPKIDMFSNQVNQKVLLHVDDTNINSQNLFDQIHGLLIESVQLRADLLKKTIPLKYKAAQTATYALRLFEKK